MSRHEGVSCDSCLKSNFGGRRFKCLICYDYDLCSDCYEEGATSTRHSADHPMQCILTRADIDLYYGGEMLNSEQPQSFICPYCKKMGFSDSALLEHVGSEHIDTGLEVVCPVCAGLPGGDPNLVTDDFAGHLTLEHRSGPRDLISFLDEPSAIRHGGVRRIPARAVGGSRPRRSNMHFSSSGGLAALSPSGRESTDPIAELLSQLSGVRRGAPQPSQLQQLQMQIQMERQQVSASTRQQLERLPRRQAQSGINPSSANAAMQEVTTSSQSASTGINAGNGCAGIIAASSSPQAQPTLGVSSINARDVVNASTPLPLAVANFGLSTGNTTVINQPQFLLARFMVPSLEETETVELEKERADRSQYVQYLTLSTLNSLSLENKGEPGIRGDSQETNTDSLNRCNNIQEKGKNLKNNSEANEDSRNLDGSGQDPQQHHRGTQTSQDDFADECVLQPQNQLFGSSNKKKLGSEAGAGKSNSANNNATLVFERRTPHQNSQSAQSLKMVKELKTSSVSATNTSENR